MKGLGPLCPILLGRRNVQLCFYLYFLACFWYLTLGGRTALKVSKLFKSNKTPKYYFTDKFNCKYTSYILPDMIFFLSPCFCQKIRGK